MLGTQREVGLVRLEEEPYKHLWGEVFILEDVEDDAQEFG